MFFKKRKPSVTIDLPYEVRGKEGIFAAPVNSISLDNSFSGSVLCLQDNPQNISDLIKIKSIHLQVKIGGVNTSYGMIIFLLFIFWDIKNENDKFTYEVLLNPADIKSYEQYILLDAQKEWKVLVVQGTEVLEIFNFDNVYNVGESINKIIESGIKYPCLNFIKAKEEYFKNYTIDDLIGQ